MAIEKQKLILIGGLVLAVLSMLVLKWFLDQKQLEMDKKAQAKIASMQKNQTAVLVAKQDIPQGVVVEAEMFDTTIFPNKFVQPQAVTSLNRVAGMVTVAPISKGEQVILSKFKQERKSFGSLAGVTPAGKRAISIVADNVASLSGMVKPGDYVDVLAIVPIPMQGQDGRVTAQLAVIPLFQNILVLAVGQNTGGVVSTGRYSEAPTSTSAGNILITLALGPQEANLVAFVQEQGKLRLVMRSPADARIEPMAPASWDSFFQYVMPQKDVSPAADTNEYIEILRGLSKEVIPLSK